MEYTAIEYLSTVLISEAVTSKKEAFEYFKAKHNFTDEYKYFVAKSVTVNGYDLYTTMHRY